MIDFCHAAWEFSRAPDNEGRELWDARNRERERRLQRMRKSLCGYPNISGMRWNGWQTPMIGPWPHTSGGP